ncbi:hypothetical protein P3T27_001412 [Kitasatospora sp. MAA19]|nr:hypothetical protein [Kitasatospora sp. MAA19]MDH6704709.1 hypothetical protein [Kitasatospora sp. MAA19]
MSGPESDGTEPTPSPQPATTTVQDITGHPARSFHTWPTDHATLFR